MVGKKIKDVGIILVFFQHFEKIHLPRIAGIELKMVHGKAINESELVHITDALDQVSMLFPYIERHPEFKPVVAKVMNYYRLIVADVIANEKSAATR
jgi:hypothetical protein